LTVNRNFLFFSPSNTLFAFHLPFFDMRIYEFFVFGVGRSFFSAQVEGFFCLQVKPQMLFYVDGQRWGDERECDVTSKRYLKNTPRAATLKV
jgi:hypothetical protein